ncbi:diazepam-binding inhibitor-like 5 [Tachyglossus aculeatus]|uniref:diazepam-binding inhibitor-like 5 n=1 Tax=Tachyglossus aculeatus TaxID=9261 RepID=UPI0018F57B7A|nr:diazepam-binding inhibitor-like 5 [Tachyglossus aculeatus]
MTEKAFKEACVKLIQLKGPVSDVEKLKIYGFYKQVTVGDIDIPRPCETDIRGKAKWDAWNSCKEMAREDAIKAYIGKVEEVAQKQSG